jgi:hypothetical protein
MRRLLNLAVFACIALTASAAPMLDLDFRDSAPDAVHRIPLPGDGAAFPRQGTLSVLFELRGPASTLELPLRAQTTPEGRPLTRGFTWIETPLFDTRLFVGRGNAGMNFNFLHGDGNTRLASQPWSRIDAAKPYVLSLTWDLDAAEIATTINGVPQGDLRHWGTDYAGLAPRPGPAALRLGGTLVDGDTRAHFTVLAARLDDRVLPEAEAAALATAWGAAPLSGEVRTLHEHPLDLSGLRLEPLYTADFSKPLDLVAEDDLFDNDQRARRPDGHEWVLEGDGRAWTEGGLLHLATNHDANDKAHLVLWLHRVFPGDILVDYDFAPADVNRGLHILFWSARRATGGDVFEPGLPRRHGDFRPYIVGELDSYHVSVFATDDQNLRRTANLRKNSGFALVAVGEDRIGGATTPGPFRVRLLKVGPRMTLAIDDTVILDYTDDGRSHGPVLDAGHLGFRLMSHTRAATIQRLEVHRVTR